MSQYRGRLPSNRLEQKNVGQAAAQLSFHPSIWDPIILFQRPGFDGGPRDAGYEIVKFLRRLATKKNYKMMAKRVKNITVSLSLCMRSFSKSRAREMKSLDALRFANTCLVAMGSGWIYARRAKETARKSMRCGLDTQWIQTSL
jgi:hypothetical protein